MEIKKEHIRYIRTWLDNKTDQDQYSYHTLQKKIQILILEFFFTKYKNIDISSFIETEHILSDSDLFQIKSLLESIIINKKKYRLNERKIAKEYLVLYFNNID